MLAARDNLLSLEREVVSLFGHATGADQIAVQKVTVANGTEEFTVGDVVTSDGAGVGTGGTGTVYAIRSSTGVWNAGTHTGACVLDLIVLTGSFTDTDNLTGAVSGAAVQSGAAVDDIAYQNVAFVARAAKGVASITCDTTVAGTAGLYTITLEDKWGGLLGFDATVMDATSPDEWQVVVVSEAVATTKTIVVQVFKGGAVADLQADDTLYFEIVLSNASSSSLARY